MRIWSYYLYLRFYNYYTTIIFKHVSGRKYKYIWFFIIYVKPWVKKINKTKIVLKQ